MKGTNVQNEKHALMKEHEVAGVRVRQARR